MQQKGCLSKIPEVTLGFWFIKIAATTLGETGGDTLSMTMNLGYLASTGIFAVLLAFIVGCILRLPQRAGNHPGASSLHA